MLMARGSGVLVLLVTVLFLAGGCASGPQGKKIPVSEKNPVEQLSNLEKDIEAARRNNLDVMAPTRFAKVTSFYNEAREGMNRESELSVILLKMSSARAHLQLAEESAQIANSALGSAIKARELARQAGAESLGEDYQDAEEDFLKLTRAIEDDNLRWAQKNEVKVARTYDQLELRAIKDRALNEARELIARAEKQNAQRLVPTTWTQARNRLDSADAYITQNRYQKEKIAEHSRQSLFQARRLNRVLEQSEKLKTMTPEQATLWMEGYLVRAAEGLASPDRRDEDFDVQAASILGVISTWQENHEALAAQLEEKGAEVEELQAKIAELEGRSLEDQSEKERLDAERRFQSLFNEVQSYFSPGEAEVYKQGNNLVIRLKTIQFPVGQEVIMPENYALLSKVQQAIGVFAQPDVVVEGHSDSTGLEAANLELSQRRASAVRQYLVANRTLPAEKLKAVGFGSAKPLASNQTPEGRAVNRRIDLVITPRDASR
ncbi:OmpA family protein [Trichloromonas sp.]|uniref:OmpA family protein n=1 Tax=Trichloromonas sp. TaxID=3069249 RepID=UPI003D819E7A